MTLHYFEKNTQHWRPDWQIVINNLGLCIQQNKVRDLGRGGFVALDSVDPEYQKADDLAKKLGPNMSLHTYVSISPESNTSGPHRDEEDVYCLQAQGITQFYVWENEQQYDYIMTPGDLLHIPSGIPHEAVPLTPRVLLSYGDESHMTHNQHMDDRHGIETS